MLLRKSDIKAINGLELSLGIEVIQKVYEKENEDKLWQIWLTRYPRMTEDNFESFDEFKDKCTGRNIDYTPTEIALKEIQEIEKKISQQKGSE